MGLGASNRQKNLGPQLLSLNKEKRSSPTSLLLYLFNIFFVGTPTVFHNVQELCYH